MTPRRLSFSLALFVGLLATSVAAQGGRRNLPVVTRQPATAEPGAAGTSAAPETPAVDPAAAAQAEAQKKAQEEAAKKQAQQQQIQKLNALRFDRRPSAILEAWAGLDLRRRAELERKREEAAAKAKAAAGASGDADGDGAADGRSDADAAAGGTASGRPTTGGAAATSTGAVSGVSTSGSIALPLPPPPPPTPGPASTASSPAIPSRINLPTGVSLDDIPPELLAMALGGSADPGQPAEPAAAPDVDPSKFDEELLDFQRNVTLGDWAAVGTWLAGLDQPVAKAAYTKLVTLVGTAPPTPMQNNRLRPFAEQNVLSYLDVIGVATAAPSTLDQAWTDAIGRLCRIPAQGGESIDTFLGLLRAETGKPAEERALQRRAVAKILFAANLVKEAREFLPETSAAFERGDLEALNLIARHHQWMFQRESEPKDLAKAWEATQSGLSVESESATLAQRQEALQRAVDLAPEIEDVLGQAWLAESFTEDVQRGMDALAAIGGGVSRGMVEHPNEPERRLDGLRLQATAVGALLTTAPERAEEWSDTLGLLAMNWLREAEHSYRYDEASARGPRVMRDVFGNVFYQGWGYNRNPTPVTALNSGQVLDARPQDAWLDAVPAERQPQFSKTFAELFLKVGEDDEAFPYIERLCSEEPEIGKQLVEEYLRVWTRNHDPNADLNSRSSYIYAYGFERTQAGIPLTRSKQDRNLRELKALVARLRPLPVEDLDDGLLVQAFETCHSRAEVYDFNDVIDVFGELELLEPETIAGLANSMRANLLTVWRRPATQEAAKTNRSRRDIEIEVTRGYQDGIRVVQSALQAHPGNWRLQLAMASLMHDRNEFVAELTNDSSYTERRAQAMEMFRQAARFYAREARELKPNEYRLDVYRTWFSAALGAVDLGAIDETKTAVPGEFEKIRNSIAALDGAETVDEHIGRFANELFRSASQVNPALKHDYLEAGFVICGDHERAAEAKELFEYYGDLLTEIDLVVEVDGSTRVGHDGPFGVFVSIRHSAEIEREAGGFGKYLQDQQTNGGYNYGRPTQDYRSKFEEEARVALQETFQVLGITFETPSVRSRAETEYGWRKTPYAYLLLQARGPEVDTLPRLRLDLDFRDGTGGYVVLPIESAPKIVDARRAEERPCTNLEVTQTLDERQAKDGKLILEVAASGRGIVPELDEILELDFEDFYVAEEDERELLVSEFDPDASEVAVKSTRTWTLTLNANKDLSSLPESFVFPEPQIEARAVYQRYQDADLESVEPAILLEATYGEVDKSWAWWVLGGVVLVTALGFLIGRSARSVEAEVRQGIEVPSQLTPFTVLGFLRQVQQVRTLQDGERAELAADIDRLERAYFGADEGAAKPELRDLTGRWKLRLGSGV